MLIISFFICFGVSPIDLKIPKCFIPSITDILKELYISAALDTTIMLTKNTIILTIKLFLSSFGL